jgi:hypothetical protein
MLLERVGCKVPVGLTGSESSPGFGVLGLGVGVGLLGGERASGEGVAASFDEVVGLTCPVVTGR